MKINKKYVIIQVLGLLGFCFMGVASSSSHDSVSRGTDWGAVGRSALVGAGAAHQGYDFIGTATSQAEAKELAASKGYAAYLWDTESGAVYAK